MQIKAIFVDIGGVLIINDASKIKDEYESKYGLSKSTVGEIFQYLQTTTRSNEEINMILAEKNITRELWDQYCNSLFNSERKNQNLYEILQQAKQAGKLVVYTTNNSETLGILIEKFNIAELADLIINSTKFGVIKPSNEFWDISLSETQKIKPDLKASEVLVIDDSEINYSSALKNGLNAVLYNGSHSDIEINKMLN